MSWITPYCLEYDDREPWQREQDDERAQHEIRLDAQTFLPEHKQHAADGGVRHPDGTSGVADRPIPLLLCGSDLGGKRHAAGQDQAGRVPSLDELRARRDTRPLSNAIGDVTPLRRPNPSEAA